MAKLKRDGVVRERHGWIQVNYQRVRAIYSGVLQATDAEKDSS